jgi:hypothetical protein
MPGLDPSVICHKLNINSGCRPVRQKKRSFAPERSRAIKTELVKLLAAGFIREIKMHPEDEEKTSFITDYGTYCYTVMPFGLKNAGATFQRGADMIYEPLLEKTVEAYVDDIVVKSICRADHTEDLKAAFDLMQKYNMRLNPKKCAFGIAFEKFLGYMVTPRGLEANPDKVTAILDMEAPKNITEVQRLVGRVTALGRFLSRSSDKCGSFFKFCEEQNRTKELGPGMKNVRKPSTISSRP